MLSARGVLKENELYWVGDGQYVMTGAGHAPNSVGEHGGGGASSGESGLSETGLYRRDTRYLCRYQWLLGGQPPQALMQHTPYPWWLHEVSGNAGLGYTMRVGLTRDLQLTGANLQDRLVLRRYVDEPHVLSLRLDADFRDMFEVRGWPQQTREVRAEAVPGGVRFSYTAEDGLALQTLVQASPEPVWDGQALVWNIQADAEVRVQVHCLQAGEQPTADSSEDTVAALERDYQAWLPDLQLRDPRDQAVLTRSTQDLRSLLFKTDQGPYPAAGIPWFVAPFGRDALIMAHLLLPHRPEVAESVARYLAERQGVKRDPATLEQPGKIMHEERDGELTRTGKTIFQPYYGSADATPLFVWLVGELARRRPELARELRPNWEAALAWLETDGDPDQDGFIEYTPDPHGIANQVWKDSGDSTFTEGGVDASGHVAVVEVQGYAYAAYRAAAEMYGALGEAGQAQVYEQRAADLQARFQAAFYWPERGYYAHGLNGDKRPMRVLVSNPAHTLWTGIIPEQFAAQVAKVALDAELWSGWGIRTLGTGEIRHNPVSYHNGSVWPHDTALAALGMARYGLHTQAAQVARALFDAARWASDGRLPELFAGFGRDGGPPVPYPAACHPQGWDAVLPLALAHLIEGQKVPAAAD